MCKTAWKRKLQATLLILTFVACHGALVLGSETPAATTRVADAAKTEEAPIIDGTVDDDLWQKATVLTDFIQAERYEGQPATERTEVRILYDARNIYVGVICFD